jgi:hypothetical protein
MELQSFLTSRNIDIMLLSETHFTLKSYLRIPHYTLYHTNHPAGTARGGTAIIIKNVIKYHPLPNYSRDYLLATSVSVEGSVGHLTISAVYLLPKHKVCKAQIEEIFITLGPRFIAGGEYNVKHSDWGCKLITPRSREVLKTLERNNLEHLSTGHTTYWPSDMNKIPDLVDVCVTKGISPDLAVAQSFFDLSYHSPILVNLTSSVIHHDPPPSLSSRRTDWDYFSHLIHHRLLLQIPLKTPADVEAAVQLFTDTVQWAG